MNPFTSIQQTIDFVTDAIAQQPRKYFYTIRLRHGGNPKDISRAEEVQHSLTSDVIGYLTFIPARDHSNPFIGIVLHSRYIYRGYAKEAGDACLALLWRELPESVEPGDGGVNCIDAVCSVDNFACRRLLEKCGFQLTDKPLPSVYGPIPLDVKAVVYSAARPYSLVRDEL